MVGNRKTFGNMLGSVDHMRHTHDPARNAFSRGQPEHGAELADDLERLVQLHDASNIAAVILDASCSCTSRSRSRSEEHTSELQSPDHLVCRLLLEKKKKKKQHTHTRSELRLHKH